MKKITLKLKISAFLLLAISALQVQGQTCPEIYLTEADGGMGNAVYKLATCGLTPELYLTINGTTGELEWAEEITTAPLDATQNWAIDEHVTPAGSGFIQITADLSGLSAGSWTMIVDQASYDGSGADPEVRITARMGDPIADTMDPNYGFDQFQRRRESGWSGPGNNALFAKPSPTGGNAQGNLRYSIPPTAAGDDVLMQSGGTIQEMRWIYVEDLPLSNEEFDTSSIFVSNPVNDELTIKGLTSNVKQLSIFSLLGKEVLTRELDGQSSLNLNVSALTSGIYLVQMKSDNGSFTKKFVKQ